MDVYKHMYMYIYMCIGMYARLYIRMPMGVGLKYRFQNGKCVKGPMLQSHYSTGNRIVAVHGKPACAYAHLPTDIYLYVHIPLQQDLTAH